MLLRLLTLAFLPPRWRLLCAAALGLAGGLGAASVVLSRAPSYLSDAPETCVNCHVMNPQYLTWQHDVHARVATCNDCHVPHDNVLHQYAFKAMDGLKHSAVFTARAEPQVMRISAMAIPVVQANCVRCHVAAVEQVVHRQADRLCWDCHRDVPHGAVRSLAATPNLFAPVLPRLGAGGPQTIGGRETRPAPPAKEATP